MDGLAKLLRELPDRLGLRALPPGHAGRQSNDDTLRGVSFDSRKQRVNASTFEINGFYRTRDHVEFVTHGDADAPFANIESHPLTRSRSPTP
ncbi:hypothetical protein NITHO_1020014 [Nitrolancea hollandica Lb]|uniref:Uncharacterized protein n=1 Tax=Nitrolancea hollandica Lb TaxID=1129897 RepID=I4ECC2_9BACT|nr:hypothetical protein NITHO_1020014 [Nitrolancea hollandica Lb]